MSLPDIVECVQSGVVQILWTSGSSIVSYGTGFFARNHLITNFHVSHDRPENAECVIRFFDDLPNKASFKYSAAEIDSAVMGSSDENAHDYVMLSLPQLLKRKPYQFKFAPPEVPRVGQTMSFLGYPLACQNLSCQAAIVSSIHSQGLTTLIQIDASVNAGNSGGPLFDIDMGLVTGVVTRKETGLIKAFRQLAESFEENVQALAKAAGSLKIAATDVFGVLRDSHAKMKTVALELDRSSNVGIGFAVKCDSLKQAVEALPL